MSLYDREGLQQSMLESSSGVKKALSRLCITESRPLHKPYEPAEMPQYGHASCSWWASSDRLVLRQQLHVLNVTPIVRSNLKGRKHSPRQLQSETTTERIPTIIILGTGGNHAGIALDLGGHGNRRGHGRSWTVLVQSHRLRPRDVKWRDVDRVLTGPSHSHAERHEESLLHGYAQAETVSDTDTGKP